MRNKHRLPFRILFEDDCVVVLDKPAGLLTTHTKLLGRAARESQLTVENILNDYVRKGQLKSKKRGWLGHRLDRETSGVMMFVAEKFRADWGNLTEKTYIARVAGVLAEDSGVFESYLLEDADGYKVRSVRVNLGSNRGRVPKLARTEWKKLSVESGTTLVEVKLKTGRKNQIRVHFSEAGHPVIGDEKYGGEKASRLYLHALRLGFKHPRTGEWLEFEAPLPGRNGKKRVSDGRQSTADNQRTIDGRQPGNATNH